MSSGFISESALEEKRRLRQEEWEKVRKPEDPKDVPEEEYDSRCLYDRLKEQKDKKQADWDEAHKLKNLVRGLDDDEAGFLDFVDQTRLAEESRILQEEKDELDEYRRAVAKENEERLIMEVKSFSSSSLAPKTTQQPSSSSIGISKASQKTKLNAIIVKRKTEFHNEEADGLKKPKLSEDSFTVETVLSKSELKCVAILPGIGIYDESSNSDSSIDSEGLVEKVQFDLCGRPVNGDNDK